MHKQHPLKLARVCALFVVFSGLLIAGAYLYVSSGGISGELTTDRVIVPAIGLLIALVGVALLFILPRYYKLLIFLLFVLSVASIAFLLFYWFLMQLGTSDRSVDFSTMVLTTLPALPPITCIGLFIWLIAAQPIAEGKKRRD